MRKKAQTVTELAVFGAILLFVIGAIVRQALSLGHVQHQNLRALRMAMKLSYEHSGGFRSGQVLNNRNAGNASRNSANLLLIEDRLTSDSAKHGALQRSPVIANAQGAHSRNFFMPIDSTKGYNLPIYDIFINGKHFPLTTAAFKTVCLAQTQADCNNLGTPYDEWIGTNDPNFWEPTCVFRYPNIGPTQTFGCAKLYTISPNNNENLSWCKTDPCSPCPLGANQCLKIYSTIPNPYIEFTTSERYDLDRDGTTDVPVADFANFAWQWVLVAAFNRDKQIQSGTPLELNTGEFFSFGEEQGSEAKNVSIDVDNDLKEERAIRTTLKHNAAGVILLMTVLDFQEGDFDFSYTTNDYNRFLAGTTPRAPSVKNAPEPGILPDVAMYARVKPGTYLEIREGRLFNASQQVVRNVQAKDHVDIIQRVIQLSNNTGRFCTGTAVNQNPQIWSDVPNPIEVCASDCFTPTNITKTCFDIDSDDERIFVRSRVLDQFGHQWVTDTTSDDYVNFVVPTP